MKPKDLIHSAEQDEETKGGSDNKINKSPVPPSYRCGVYTPVFPFGEAPRLEGIQLTTTTIPSPVFEVGLYKSITSEFKDFFEGKERYAKYKIPHKRALLFVGPPGTGKSFLIRAMVEAACKNEYNTYAFNINRDNYNLLMNDYMLEWVENHTYADSKFIYMLEDFETLIYRAGKENLLNIMDGIQGRQNQIIIASTNHPKQIDSAFLRPGRFDRLFLIPLPDWKTRKKILEAYFIGSGLQDKISKEEWKTAEKNTEGMSGAFLYEIFKKAVSADVKLGDACKAVKDYFDSIQQIINYNEKPAEDKGRN